MRAAKTMRRWGRRFWRGLREWCGDTAYERYVGSAAKKSGYSRMLTAEEFYLEQLGRKYSRPNCCC